MSKGIVPSGNTNLPAKKTARYVRASKSENTQRTYAAAWRDFSQFCEWKNVSPLPASPETIVAYLEFIAEGSKASTIEVRLAAIRFAHKTKKCPDPTDDELVRAVHAGIRREIGVAPDRKSPITADKLVRLIEVQPPTLAGVRNCALILLGFAGAFRRSELVGLDRADIDLSHEKVVVNLRRSKTDQEGKGMKKNIPAMSNASTLCPVSALSKWLLVSGINDGPLFRKIDRWGNIGDDRLTDHAVATIIKDAAREAGLDEKELSGHSLRAGFVTQSARAGVPEWQIQEVTGHKSATVLRGYIRDEGVGQQDAIKKALGG